MSGVSESGRKGSRDGRNDLLENGDQCSGLLSVLILELTAPSVLVMGVGRIHNCFVGCFVITSLGDGLIT